MDIFTLIAVAWFACGLANGVYYYVEVEGPWWYFNPFKLFLSIAVGPLLWVFLRKAKQAKRRR